MAFTPKRIKYRKTQRGRRTGIAVAGGRVCFGEYGLKSLECGYIKNTQLEAFRVLMTRALRRGGKFWIRIFSDKPITKKPQETRMGKGKGDVDGWVAVIRRGAVLFEIGGVPKDYAKEIFKSIAYKLSMKTRFVER